MRDRSFTLSLPASGRLAEGHGKLEERFVAQKKENPGSKANEVSVVTTIFRPYVKTLIIEMFFPFISQNGESA